MLKGLTQHRVLQIATAAVAVGVLCFIGWGIVAIVTQPDIGALWRKSGYVYYASASSPLRAGDILLTVDGVPLAKSGFPYFRSPAGEADLRLGINRQGQALTLTTRLERPATGVMLLTRLAAVLVALVFWFVGATLVRFSPAATRPGLLFFIFCQLMAIILIGGNITSVDWLTYLLIDLTWWLVPISIHLHLLFPLNRLGRRTPPWLIGLYVMAGLGMVYFLTAIGIISPGESLRRTIPVLYNLWLMSGLLTVVFLLVKAYRLPATPTARRQVGVLVLAGACAAVPLISLTLLPELVSGRAFLPIEYSLLFLIAVPTGYGYAITHYHFIQLDRTISRGAAAVIVLAIIGFIYFFLTEALRRIAPPWLLSSTLFNLGMIMALVWVYGPLRRRLQGWVDHFFYGGWYDYPSVVGQITQMLHGASDLQALAATFSRSLQKTIRVEWACLLLPSPTPRGSVLHLAGQSDAADLLQALELSHIPTISAALSQRSAPLASQQELHQELAATPGLTSLERKLLRYSGLHLWVLIEGRQQTFGVLLLGPKEAGDIFNAADSEILAVASRQASAALQNVQLIHQLEEKAVESDRYQREILRAREDERKRLARELHDEVIQALVGLRYRLANVQTSIGPARLADDERRRMGELQDGIGELIQTTRELCHVLRPPALDLGLIPSIRSLTSQFEKQHNLNIDLTIVGDRQVVIHEDIAISLYRCTTEALQNAYKHAQASQIVVQLELTPDLVTLTIHDNGRGFIVPERLGSLMETNHFGLVGMRERVEFVGGLLEVNSQAGQGTWIQATIPLRTGSPVAPKEPHQATAPENRINGKGGA